MVKGYTTVLYIALMLDSIGDSLVSEHNHDS